jgi:hypothetical protein
MSLSHATLEPLSASADRAQAQIDRALANIEALPVTPDESLIRVRVDLLTDLSQNIYRLAAVHKTIIALREQLPGSVTSLRRLNRNIADLENALAKLEGRTQSARTRYAPQYSAANPPTINAVIRHARLPRDPAAREHTPFFEANPALKTIFAASSLPSDPEVDALFNGTPAPAADLSTFSPTTENGAASTSCAAALSQSQSVYISTSPRAFLADLDLDILADTRCVPFHPRLNAPDITDRLEDALSSIHPATSSASPVGRGSDPTPPHATSHQHASAPARIPSPAPSLQKSTPPVKVPTYPSASPSATPVSPLDDARPLFSRALMANLIPHARPRLHPPPS